MSDTDTPHPSMPHRDPRREQEGLSTSDFAGRQGEGAQPLETRSFAEAQPGGRPGAGGQEEHPTPLFDPNEVDELRRNWTDIQAGFVDEPRKAVEDADRLVALTMKRLAEMFAKERESLEGQWDRGDKVSTEDLRLALRRYRSFFDRLLSV